MPLAYPSNIISKNENSTIRNIIWRNDEMKICTLNINKFRGQKSDVISDNEIKFNMIEVVKYIKIFLKEEDNLIILQEIPYKIWDKELSKFILNNTFNDFMKFFDSEYKVLKPKYLKDAIGCTLGIVKKNSKWESNIFEDYPYDNKKNYANKIVELTYESMVVYGFHMPWTRGKDLVEEKFWNTFVTHARSMKDRRCVLIGDFNSSYEIGSKHRSKLLEICDGDINFKDMVKQGTVTYYTNGSTLDHVFVSDSVKNDINEVLISDNSFSDHAAIILDIQ